MSSASEKLIVQEAEGIGRLILNQPAKRNAICLEMWTAIGDAMEGFAANNALRVVIVSGAGGKAFSAGADISEFAQHRSSPEGRAAYDAAMRRAFERLANSPKLTIAMIDGVCVGGGAEVAMDCDILVASNSSRFAITPAKLGLGYSLPDVERLVRHVGARWAKEILATAKFYDADEALAMGWVNHVVPAEQLETFVNDLASAVARNAPLTVRAAKLMVNETVKAPADRDPALCQNLVDACYESRDYLEGQRAFAEKRAPNFTGH